MGTLTLLSAQLVSILRMVGASGSDFLSDLPAIAQAIVDMFISLFTGISSVFYTPAQTVGDVTTPGGLTFVGVICIIVLIIGLSILLLNWVRSLISRR